jgi:hypothetical protein
VVPRLTAKDRAGRWRHRREGCEDKRKGGPTNLHAQPLALRARGKNGGVIACALAHRANRIAFALVRDQAGYDPHPVATAGLTVAPSQLRPAVPGSRATPQASTRRCCWSCRRGSR